MSDRPNILFIFTDQQTLGAMSAYGNPHLRTPHMDSIAASGVRFEKSYCASPVCGPSRSSLVTGRMPHETGVDVNGESIDSAIPNIGQLLSGAGYRTAWAGKWHLPESYPSVGLGSVPGFEVLQPAQTSGRGSDTDAGVADHAVSFLQRQHDRPFLLGVSMHNPHDICGWIGRHRDPGTIDDVDALPPLPDNFAIDPEEPEFIRACRRRPHYGAEGLNTLDWNEDQWRFYIHAYYRFTEEVDALVGRVLASLRDQGLEEETVVIFTSDHGEGVAAHRWVVKLMLYEESTTVPMIVSWRGHTPAGVVDSEHLVSGVDILPTICDYAGVTPPAELAGISLRPLIDDPTRPGRDFLVSELQPDTERPELRGRMLRSRRFKYVAFSEGRNPEMLFAMEADPGETRNLARRADLGDELNRHRQLLRSWIEARGDEFAVPE